MSQGNVALARMHPAERSRGIFLAAVVAILYGRTVGIGFLSDDFLYLAWASDSFGTLVSRLTTESYPRTLRPLLAPLWWLSATLGSAAVIRVVSLSAHLANSYLVHRLAARPGSSPFGPLAAGTLFAAFPLSPEAVAWPSGAFDLVACLCALGSLSLLPRDQSWTTEEARKRSWLAVCLYGVGLFAKESILLLPVVAFLLFGRSVRRGAWGMTCVGTGYLALRFSLFGGPGGYLSSDGGSLLSLSRLPSVLSAAAHTLALQIPHRVLVPAKDSGSLELPLLAASVVLLIGLFAGGRIRKPVASLIRSSSAFLTALLPVMPILGVEWHHEGSRLLYFPFAVVVIGLSRAFIDCNRMGRTATGGLLVLWAVTTWINTESWVRAGHAVDKTLEAVVRVEHQLPTGALVLVDTPESVEGAYVFRNGLPQAVDMLALRRNLAWHRGTSAMLGPLATDRLGRDLFVIQPGDNGEPLDLTECEHALFGAKMAANQNAIATTLRAETELAGSVISFTTISERLDQRQVFVRVTGSDCTTETMISGTLYWRDPSAAPFTVDRSRAVQFEAGGAPTKIRPTPVRLPPLSGFDRIQLRLDLDRALPTPCLPVLVVLPLPKICSVHQPLEAFPQTREPTRLSPAS